MCHRTLALVGFSIVSGCFYAPVPAPVKISGMSVASIRRQMLSIRDAWDIFDLRQGLGIRLRIRSKRQAEGHLERDRSEIIAEWREAASALEDVGEKAVAGWPGLYKTEGLYPGLHLEDLKATEVVVLAVFESAAGLSAIAPAEVREDFVDMFYRFKPRGGRLLEKWLEVAQQYSLPIER